TAMFAPMGIRVVSLNDYDDVPDVVEDGATFYENALKKARTIAELFGIPTLADDSGLCVDALDGRPGVFSARYAGDDATDQENNLKLLQQLADVQMKEDQQSNLLNPQATYRLLSSARFVSVLVLYDPVSKSDIHVEGICEGIVI